MALKKTKQTSFGVDVTDAYHRVEHVRIEDKNRISFCVRSYADTEKQFFSEQLYSCSYDLNGVNPIACAYLHLKDHPDFAGSKDC